MRTRIKPPIKAGGMTYEQIAAALGCSTGTVQTIERRAFLKLRLALIVRRIKKQDLLHED
jgi:DNA-directed RNA polymerase specialized sigma24 family protein